MEPFGSTFYEIAAILAVAAGLGALATTLRQPLIVAFIAVGILVGPAGLGLVQAQSEIDLLAQIGIALLLFVVGLKLDVTVVRTMGTVALATGLGQVAFTSIVGFIIAILMGIALVPAVYIAVALTFSSTIIIVKLLSDKREIDSLHGRIAIGFLIVQDIVVVLVMIALSAIGVGGERAGLGLEVAAVVAKGLGFLVVIALLMRFVLPRLLHLLARSTELLVVFAIAWAVALAAAGDAMGFSKEVGAFVAGVSLASTQYREAIGARLVSLRDFLLLFFFINLGSQLDLSLLGAELGRATIFSFFVLIGNPLIVMVIMGLMGYRRRTGFLAGLTVAQISEFSLILAALGLSLGHIDRSTMGLITLVGLVTIGLSTYLIIYSHQIYERIAPALAVFERKVAHREEGMTTGDSKEQADVILFGMGRYGSNIARRLGEKGVKVLGVDFDPEAVQHCQRRGLAAQYGDAEDPEFPGTLPLDEAETVISSVPDRHVGLILLHALRDHGYAGEIWLTAHSAADADALYNAGADRVLLPFADAAKEVADQVMADDSDAADSRGDAD